MRRICDQKKSEKIRVISVIRVPFKQSDPNQSLQATAGSAVFISFCGFAVGFGLSDVFGKTPPRLNSGR